MTTLAVRAVGKVGLFQPSRDLRLKSGFRTFGIVNPGASGAEVVFLFKQQPRRSRLVPE